MEITKQEKEFYEGRMKHLKRQLKQVQKDVFLDEQYKQVKLAVINEQIELLKKDFCSRLAPKVKYRRNLKKIEDKKEIEKSDYEDYINFRI